MFVLYTWQDTPIYLGLLMRRTYPVLGKFDTYDDACGWAFNVCGFKTSAEFFIDQEQPVVRVYHWTDQSCSMVAEVSTDNLDEAYALTNHIDSDWTRNKRVLSLPGEHRSTSVGDMLERDGKYYLVEAAGFTPIDGPQIRWYWMRHRARLHVRSVVARIRSLRRKL